VPGRRADRSSWGDLPLVIDTSAWFRAHHQAVRAEWTEALVSDRLRLSPLARLEILLATRDPGTFDELVEELSALRPAPLGGSVVRAAEAAMRALTRRSAGAHRLPIVDYLVAAAAQELGGAVLHYDRDYGTLAEVMSFDAVWLAPPGSLP
jgi:predicted nucleic acid-binding protein